MKLTRAGDYAIRCVLRLACEDGRTIARRELARLESIPYDFLGKVTAKLARAGLIEILQGVRGGCRLARPPSAITLLQILEAVEGEVAVNRCLIRPDTCGRSATCPVHEVLARARQEFRRILEGASVARLLASPRRHGRARPRSSSKR